MSPPGFSVPYPDLSVLLGGGGPPAPASAGAAAAAPVATGGKRVVTEIKESDGDQGYIAELIGAQPVTIQAADEVALLATNGSIGHREPTATARAG